LKRNPKARRCVKHVSEQLRIPLLSLDEEQLLLGVHDRHVKEVENRFGVRLRARHGELTIQGSEEAVRRLSVDVESVLMKIRAGKNVSPAEIEDTLLGNHSPSGQKNFDKQGITLHGGQSLPTARTPRQQDYLEALSHSELVLATGPAGTGKTYLAVAEAVRALRSGQVQRLIFTRPAVEAGEKLGFLPGDLVDKIDPYLQPLFDALNDLVGPANARRLRDLDIIAIAPLAFMRGRTFRNSFVVLDEAQNATSVQLKMFLTRLGEGARAVVTGDISQTDLPANKSGLADAIRRLEGVEGISVVHFDRTDVQRSALVQRIVEAYGEEND